MHFTKWLTAAACCFTLALAEPKLVDKETFQKKRTSHRP